MGERGKNGRRLRLLYSSVNPRVSVSPRLYPYAPMPKKSCFLRKR